jgi:hypothetical protein
VYTSIILQPFLSSLSSSFKLRIISYHNHAMHAPLTGLLLLPHAPYSTIFLLHFISFLPYLSLVVTSCHYIYHVCSCFPPGLACQRLHFQASYSSLQVHYSAKCQINLVWHIGVTLYLIVINGGQLPAFTSSRIFLLCMRL